MPFVNETTVDVLTTAAEQLRHVLGGLERGEPVDMGQLEACALNLFTIVSVLNGLRNASDLLLAQRYGPPLVEEEVCDDFLQRASEELPAGRAHIVLLASKMGRPPYAVANVPPYQCLELLEQLQVKISVHAGIARRVVD